MGIPAGGNPAPGVGNPSPGAGNPSPGGGAPQPGGGLPSPGDGGVGGIGGNDIGAIPIGMPMIPALDSYANMFGQDFIDEVEDKCDFDLGEAELNNDTGKVFESIHLHIHAHTSI